MLIRFKLDGKKYELDPNRLTLGELETLENECGLDDAADLNPFKANQVRWFAFFAVSKAQPDLTEDEAQKLAKTVVSGDVFADYMKQIEKAQEEAADPPVPADGAGKTNGSPARKTSGKRRSPVSTG